MPGLAPEPPRRYALEVPTGRWCHPPEILFTEPSPRCDTCGEPALWLPPDGRSRYRVSCGCGEDELVEWPGMRFCVGGTLGWWRRGNMDLADAAEQTRNSLKALRSSCKVDGDEDDPPPGLPGAAETEDGQ